MEGLGALMLGFVGAGHVHGARCGRVQILAEVEQRRTHFLGRVFRAHHFQQGLEVHLLSAGRHER